MIRTVFLSILFLLAFAIGCSPDSDVTKSKVDPAIARLIRQLETEEDDKGYYTAIELAKFKETAVPPLVDGLESDNPSTRKWCARALANIVGGYGDFSGRETVKPAGLPLLTALAREKDESVAWYMAQAIGSVQPDASQAVPILLLALRDAGGPTLQREIVSVLEGYGAEAATAKPALLELLDASSDDWLQEMTMSAIKELGIEREDAQKLSRIKFAESSQAAVEVMHELLDHPDLAMRFLESHPAVFQQATYEAQDGKLVSLLKDSSPESRELRQYIRAREDLPDVVMVFLGDSEFLPKIRARMNDASKHKRTFLKACARALGEDADRIVRISADEAGDFKPKSAHPGTDPDRWANGSGHGDGFTPVLVTGRLELQDGSPVIAPRFFNTNDRMLLGIERSDPVPLVNYDQKTGRFVFYTSVFAAYSMGKGQTEPGPYQTGKAMIRIEALEAQPLTVSFYDEMPDVLITLSPGAGYSSDENSSDEKPPTKKSPDGLAMPNPIMP